MTDHHEQSLRLLREIGQGSAAAFEQFYEQYAALVYQIAQRMMGDPMEAEDLCHDIFLEVYRTAGQYDPARGSIEAWLAVKTRSRCLDRLRRMKRDRLHDWDAAGLPWTASESSPEEQVLKKLERETVREVLDTIPQAQREAVYGMYFQAKSHRELAEKLERPLGTVKSLIRYGLINVRKQLNQLGWLAPSGGAKERE
ncbi:sigma-70 family RNA polymerase sigma factor [Brevibacillus sp. SYP-B805]|uniref:RNA polymerase sigma factor n=1 Tax=Brevibacillus sp. SYP-B805 TaxID=1578199 RepID=UPI003216A5AC